MRKPHGAVIVSSPESSDQHFDTITCAHCNSIVIVKGATPDQLGGFCRQCMSHTCAKPKCNASCIPFEKALDRYEKRENARAALLRAVTGDD